MVLHLTDPANLVYCHGCGRVIAKQTKDGTRITWKGLAIVLTSGSVNYACGNKTNGVSCDAMTVIRPTLTARPVTV